MVCPISLTVPIVYMSIIIYTLYSKDNQWCTRFHYQWQYKCPSQQEYQFCCQYLCPFSAARWSGVSPLVSVQLMFTGFRASKLQWNKTTIPIISDQSMFVTSLVNVSTHTHTHTKYTNLYTICITACVWIHIMLLYSQPSYWFALFQCSVKFSQPFYLITCTRSVLILSFITQCQKFCLSNYYFMVPYSSLFFSKLSMYHEQWSLTCIWLMVILLCPEISGAADWDKNWIKWGDINEKGRIPNSKHWFTTSFFQPLP